MKLETLQRTVITRNDCKRNHKTGMRREVLGIRCEVLGKEIVVNDDGVERASICTSYLIPHA